MNLAEAAMLAGLFKAPTKFAPHINLPAARARANVVLDNLVESRLHDRRPGVRRAPQSGRRRSTAATSGAPNYFLDWAFDEMKKLVDTFPQVGDRPRLRGAHRARPRPAARRRTTRSRPMLRQYGRDYHAKQAAVVIADLDGAVRAMVGGRDYGESQFNRATDALRQPGSSFKPYVYATALVNGFKPTSIVVDAPVCIGNWCPQNYSGGYSGSMTLTAGDHPLDQRHPGEALDRARQGQPQDSAAPRSSQTARSLGIRTPLPDTPSLPIGADEVNVLEHTVAYATFPNRGHGGDAARHPRGAHRHRRTDLALRPRRQEAARR